MRGSWLLIAVLVGCGDDGPSGPGTLVADPEVVTGCAPGVGGGLTRAKVVECTDELARGRLASGRIGDLVIENELMRVIIRGPGEGYYLQGSSGGGIVDVMSANGEDLVKEIQPSVELAVGAFDEIVITEAGNDAPAEIVVRGPASSLDLISAVLDREPPPLIIEHRYRLAAGSPHLELETRVFAQPGAGEVDTPTLYEAVFLGGRTTAYTTRGVIGASGTTTSYALVYPPGSSDPQLVDIGGIRLVVGPSLDLGVPQRRFLVVGDGSLASVTGPAWELHGDELGTIRGTSAPNVDIEIRQGSTLVTIARTTASGAFSAVVPVGAYTLRATGLGRAPGIDATATVLEDVDTTVAVQAGGTGTLEIRVHDDANRELPARVKIEQAGQDTRIEWADASGRATLPIAPGTWSVSISRGLEYEAFVASSVVVADGQTVAIAATLEHVVDTSGWISLDTHLHSELSTDSTLPIEDRLRAVAGEGVEMPVSTDHDMIVDYAPVIATLGLGAFVGTMIGEEASSIIWGHTNSYPLTPDPSRAGGGAVTWLKKSPGEVFAALRGGNAQRIVQVNHPRDGTTSLFNAIDLDPVTLTARKDPTSLGLPAGTDLSDLRFDAMEINNGARAEDVEQVFGDWLAMVAAGHPACAMGSSDSHGATAFAGEARSFVYVGAGKDDPAIVDPAAIIAAIKARHVVIGSHAFVTAGIVTTAGTSLPGDTVNVTGLAQVTLHIKVQAASWQPLSKIRIYQGRTELRTINLDPQDALPVRFDADVTLPAPADDTFYVVRVDRAGPGDPVVTKNLPAITNPLFAHVD